MPIRCRPTLLVWNVLLSLSSRASPSTDNNQQYIFAVHPHGIHGTPLSYLTTKKRIFVGSSISWFGRLETDRVILAATIMFQLFRGERERSIFGLHWGYIDASRDVASQALQCGRSLFVGTGGEEEAMWTTKGEDVVVLWKRQGLICPIGMEPWRRAGARLGGRQFRLVSYLSILIASTTVDSKDLRESRCPYFMDDFFLPCPVECREPFGLVHQYRRPIPK
jgi:hypothetical protein